MPTRKQVESLAIQACRAVCWFHRSGLVHGDLTPDNFIVLGGTGAGGGNSTGDNPPKERGLAAAGTGGGGGGGGGSVEGAGRWGGELRLMVGRSVARRPDASGGCPRHPLLEVRATPCRRCPPYVGGWVPCLRQEITT